MKEISEVSAKALAASLLNEQLVTKLNINKSKVRTYKQSILKRES